MKSDDDGLCQGVQERRAGQLCRVLFVAEVARLDPYGGHLGALQQLPSAWVGTAVGEAGSGHNLALDQVGQVLSDR